MYVGQRPTHQREDKYRHYERVSSPPRILRWPLTEGAPASNGRSLVAHPIGTVLVVDDLDPNARLLELLLRRDGHHVQRAHDGLEALEMVAREQPDLVLMDVIMPLLDGFETCRGSRAIRPRYLVPVVLVSALTDTRDRVRGLEVGADDFLSKPVNEGELRARVRSLLRIKRYTDELDQRRIGHFEPGADDRSARRRHGRTLPAAGPLCGAARDGARSCRRGERRSAARRLSPRHRQGRHPGRDTAEALPLDDGGVRDHEAAHRHRRSALRRTAIAAPRPAHRALASRAHRRQRLPGRLEGVPSRSSRRSWALSTCSTR